MKYLLLLCYLLLDTGAHAQQATSPLPTPPVVYCMFIAEDGYFENSLLRLDYG